VKLWILTKTKLAHQHKLGYTVSFASVLTGKYRTEDKLNRQKIHKLNTTLRKQTTQNTAKQTKLS